MKLNYRALASAALVLTSCANLAPAATTAQTTFGPQSASSSFDILFTTPILDATQLVSISDGAVFTGEGATLIISAIFTDNQTQQVFSQFQSNYLQNKTLSSVTGNTFTAFSLPKDVKGLRFLANGFPPGTITIPSSTVATFNVVPEPTSAILATFGCVVLGLKRRRAIA